MKVKPTKCTYCGKSEPEVRFATLEKTGYRDTLCVRCRFDSIDARHSDIRQIHKDMEDVGIPLGSGVPPADE